MLDAKTASNYRVGSFCTSTRPAQREIRTGIFACVNKLRGSLPGSRALTPGASEGTITSSPRLLQVRKPIHVT